MFVGICELDIFIPESGSLKSKRFVLSSLKTRLRNKFNISVAEVGDTEKWQRAHIGISMVANERKFLDKTLQQVLDFVHNFDGIELLKHQWEIV
jgi:uncharacterized protein YlxP (DUF503 family)